MVKARVTGANIKTCWTFIFFFMCHHSYPMCIFIRNVEFEIDSLVLCMPFIFLVMDMTLIVLLKSIINYPVCICRYLSI